MSSAANDIFSTAPYSRRKQKKETHFSLTICVCVCVVSTFRNLKVTETKKKFIVQKWSNQKRRATKKKSDSEFLGNNPYGWSEHVIVLLGIRDD